MAKFAAHRAVSVLLITDECRCHDSQFANICLLQVHGKVCELGANHSASRVIQFCMKEGSKQDRDKLCAEIKSNIVPLSKSKYGRHLVQKLINVASKEEVPGRVTLAGHKYPAVCFILTRRLSVRKSAFASSQAANDVILLLRYLTE